MPLGACIGWVDDDSVYPEPSAAFRAVQVAGGDVGEGLTGGLQVKAGGSAIEASKIAGHSDLEMTGEYTFVTPDRQNELTRRIQEKLAEAKEKQAEKSENATTVLLQSATDVPALNNMTPAASRVQ